MLSWNIASLQVPSTFEVFTRLSKTAMQGSMPKSDISATWRRCMLRVEKESLDVVGASLVISRIRATVAYMPGYAPICIFCRAYDTVHKEGCYPLCENCTQPPMEK